jgi:hypothetical protein
MHWMFAAALVWFVGCSVYDDGLLRPGAIASSATRAEAGPAVPSMPTSGAPAGSGAAPGNPGEPRDAGATQPAADGGESCVLRAPPDYCAQLPALPHPPTIDGLLECGLSLSPMQPLGWKGTNPAPAKQASYAAAWHRDGLYVYVEVHGEPIVPHPASEPLFCGDAVEIYVDADAQSDDAGAYDAMGTMQFVVAAPAATAPEPTMEAWRFIQGKPQGAWISKALRVTALPDGYSVETFIGAADVGLWEWSPKDQLGFSIAIDVGDAPAPTRSGCIAQSGQFFLRLGDPRGACPGEPWCDASAFCDAELLQ